MKLGFFLGRLLNHKEYNSFRSKFRCNMVVFYVIRIQQYMPKYKHF